MIRGAVCPVDLGDAKRGREQRGRRLGLVVSIEQNIWPTVTVIPASARAQPAIFRPAVVTAGRDTKLLIDQIRNIDVSYVTGELVDYLSRDDMTQVEHGLSRYFGPCAGSRAGPVLFQNGANVSDLLIWRTWPSAPRRDPPEPRLLAYSADGARSGQP